MQNTLRVFISIFTPLYEILYYSIYFWEIHPVTMASNMKARKFAGLSEDDFKNIVKKKLRGREYQKIIKDICKHFSRLFTF